MSLIRIEKRGIINEVDNDNFVEHLNTNFEEALPRSILDDENYVYWIAIPVNEIPDLHRAGHSDAWDTLLCNQLIDIFDIDIFDNDDFERLQGVVQEQIANHVSRLGIKYTQLYNIEAYPHKDKFLVEGMRNNIDQTLYVPVFPKVIDGSNWLTFYPNNYYYYSRNPWIHDTTPLAEQYGDTALRSGVWQKDVGRFVHRARVEGNRNYTQCYFCNCFNKVRTHMVPIRHAQRVWNGRKNVCLECVLLAHTGVHRDKHGYFGFDGEKQFVYQPGDSWESRVSWQNSDTETRLISISGEYGRAFRKMQRMIDDQIIAGYLHIDAVIKKSETLDLPEWSYGFETRIQVYNHTFPIFLTRRVANNPEGTNFMSSSIGYDWQDTDWYASNGPFFGVEFECYIRNDRQDFSGFAEVVGRNIKMFHPTDYPNQYEQDGTTQLLIAKSDGSLTDGSGVEFVSQPLSYRYWMDDVPERFWSYFQNNFRARNSSSCGIHIHIGWDSMRVYQRYIFLSILNAMNRQNSELLQRVSGRGDTHYSRWLELDYNRAANKVFQVAVEKNQDRDWSGMTPKYSAINTEHSDTIELRYFQGNTGERSIKGMLQFVNLLFNISRHAYPEGEHWDFMETEIPEELNRIVSSIEANPDAFVLRSAFDEEYNISDDDLKYFIYRIDAEYVQSFLTPLVGSGTMLEIDERLEAIEDNQS